MQFSLCSFHENFFKREEISREPQIICDFTKKKKANQTFYVKLNYSKLNSNPSGHPKASTPGLASA